MKKEILSIMACAVASAAMAQAPAFPGAEGYGRYTTGGRGKTVVHVTNLNDSGTGSFRSAVSSSNRIVVFDVSGIIELKSDLKFKDNITVAGQTAPGEGITLRYYTVQPGANNIIRFIRFRRGEEKNVNDGADATWQRRKKNIILDHCSFSWSIDEVASYYDNRDFTMQWCTAGEALNDGHEKGEHSYGGIWGGKNASFHHNMILHANNRTPRFNGARYQWTDFDKIKYENTVLAERVDFRNCVMYNWGTGGCYGGPGGGFINMVNNYYKAGPGTSNKTCVTTCSAGASGNSTPDDMAGMYSKYYINGNYVTAAREPENYDWNGVKTDGGKGKSQTFIDTNNWYLEGEGKEHSIVLEAPIDIELTTTHDAQVAYEKVLSFAGASLMKDMVDARYEQEARTGTAPYGVGRPGIINHVADQGEYSISTQGEARPTGFDTDGDGMPDDWEIANGLNPNDKSDGAKYTIDTEKEWYTNVEVYLNSLVEHIVKAQNADALTAVEEYYPAYNVPSGIEPAKVTSEVTKIEYYTLDGVKLAVPANGINIRKITLANGSIATDKVIK